MGLNARGAVAGFYRDSSGIAGGFTRDAQGRVTTFRINGTNTSAYAINDLGEAGGFSAAGSFLRHPSGRVTLLTAPGTPVALNNRGELVGSFFNGNRSVAVYASRSGNVQTFDPGEGNNAVLYAIADSGDMAGAVFPSATPSAGECLVCSTPGGCARFQPAGSLASSCTGVNSSGQVAGVLTDSATDAYRAFIREPSGNLTIFDAPGAKATYATAINGLGEVVGSFLPTGGSLTRPFVREAGGGVSSFSVPGATWANPVAINDSGVIAGYFGDTAGVVRGFIRSR